MDWKFLILLLDLSFPIYNSLIWVLQICYESEPTKQLNFLNKLVSEFGFDSSQNDTGNSVRRGCYVKTSAQDPNMQISVILESSGPDPIAWAYQRVIVNLNQSPKGCLKQINWHWKEDANPFFLFWDRSCPFFTMKRFKGDYYESRAAFMESFASILDSLD